MELDIYSKEIFGKLKFKQNEIESFFGAKLNFVEAQKASRIKIFCSGDINDRDSWRVLFEWFVATALKFKELIAKFL